MDLTLTKFITILVLCEITNYVTGIPIKDTAGYVNSRYKRSPSDNFSLFGFGIKTPFSVPNPITSVRENINNFGNLFRPAPDQSQYRDDIRKQQFNQPQEPNQINNKTFIISKPDEVLAPQKGIKDYEPVPPPSMNNTNKPDFVTENSKINPVVQENNDFKNNTKSVVETAANKNDAEKTSPSLEITKIVLSENKKKDMEMEIDPKLLEYIFNTNENTLDDTTAYPTETADFTTETGDYNSTTIDDDDDLLRIPAPVVASLLG